MIARGARKPRVAGKLRKAKLRIAVVGPGGPGTIVLRAPKANRTLRLKRSAKLGTGRFTIAQDGVRTVTIKLTKPAIRALRRARTPRRRQWWPSPLPEGRRR